MVVSLGVALALALVAVSVILWKIYDYFSYRKEYKKFMAEQEKAMGKSEVMGNPLYRSPISEFKVPDEFYRDNVSNED